MTSSTICRCVLALAIGVVGCGDDEVAATRGSSGAGGVGGRDGGEEVCQPVAGHKPISIHGGDRTMLAVMDDGTLYCWRENGLGQCDASDWGVLLSIPTRVRNLPCVVAASAGNVGIARTAGGRAYTWGYETSGERGEGDGASPDPLTPTRLELEGVTHVSATDTAMGAVAGGRAYWWGRIQQSSPAPVFIADGVSGVAIGAVVSCLLELDGDVGCWGRSSDGGLGPATGSSDVPVDIVLDVPATMVAVRAQTGCALDETASLSCWGSNGDGALGRGAALPEFDAMANAIMTSGPFDGIVSSVSTFCAWRPNGEVFCWGNNLIAKYAPFDDVPQSVPRRVPELEPARQVAVVYDEVCALGFDDVVRCRVGDPDPELPQEARVLAFTDEEPEPR